MHVHFTLHFTQAMYSLYMNDTDIPGAKISKIRAICAYLLMSHKMGKCHDQYILYECKYYIPGGVYLKGEIYSAHTS